MYYVDFTENALFSSFGVSCLQTLPSAFSKKFLMDRMNSTGLFTNCVVSATAPVNWLTCHHKLRYSYYSAFLFAVSNSMCMFLQSDPCDRDASARGTVSRTCRGVPRSSVTCRLCKIYLQCKKSMRRGFYTLVLSFIQQQRLQEAPELINYQLLKAMCTGIA